MATHLPPLETTALVFALLAGLLGTGSRLLTKPSTSEISIMIAPPRLSLDDHVREGLAFLGRVPAEIGFRVVTPQQLLDELDSHSLRSFDPQPPSILIADFRGIDEQYLPHWEYVVQERGDLELILLRASGLEVRGPSQTVSVSLPVSSGEPDSNELEGDNRLLGALIAVSLFSLAQRLPSASLQRLLIAARDLQFAGVRFAEPESKANVRTSPESDVQVSQFSLLRVAVGVLIGFPVTTLVLAATT